MSFGHAAHRAQRHGSHRVRRAAYAGTGRWAMLLLAGLLVALETARGGPAEPLAAPAAAPATAQGSGANASNAGNKARPARRGPAGPGHVYAVALRAGPVRVRVDGFLSWALLDGETGRISGSANLSAPSDTMSMVKAWLAADYLRRTVERGVIPSASRLRQLTAMIRDSDNAVAEAVFRALGRTASIERLIAVCGLTDSSPVPGRWSNTRVSARDTVRMGACLADGRAAGRWTSWLLNEMRHVRGVGDFGVRTALPADVAATVAIKNGWLLRDEDGRWHISCLAIGDGWILGVLARYPGRLGFAYGTALCRRVGEQLIAV